MDRGAIYDFLKKAYELVNDPSTDSVISWNQDGKSFTVWHPAECLRNQFPKLLGITNFERLEILGITKNESRRLLEFASDDFVRGQPELLDKIVECYWAPWKAHYEIKDRIKNCKNIEEEELVLKENQEKNKRERREKALAKDLDDLMKRIASERETREGGVLSKDVEDRVQRILQL